VPTHDIVVIGASAGGVEALSKLVRVLPVDLPASVFVVLHVPAESQSALPQILNRVGRLPAAHATDNEPIEPGHIYIAPPDHHLLVRRGAARVARGPRENGHRPAIDPLFRTAAHAYGSRVIGVVLSGALDDGTTGLAVIKRRGGIAIVQNPEEALVSGMPTSALENVRVDHCLPVERIAFLLADLVSERPGDAAGPNGQRDLEEVPMVDGDTIGGEALRSSRPERNDSPIRVRRPNNAPPWCGALSARPRAMGPSRPTSILHNLLEGSHDPDLPRRSPGLLRPNRRGDDALAHWYGGRNRFGG